MTPWQMRLHYWCNGDFLKLNRLGVKSIACVWPLLRLQAAVPKFVERVCSCRQSGMGFCVEAMAVIHRMTTAASAQVASGSFRPNGVGSLIPATLSPPFGYGDGTALIATSTATPQVVSVYGPSANGTASATLTCATVSTCC